MRAAATGPHRLLHQEYVRAWGQRMGCDFSWDVYAVWGRIESKLQEGQSTEEVFKASLGRGRALNVLVRAPGASATR